jgi:hypothetical protein
VRRRHNACTGATPKSAADRHPLISNINITRPRAGAGGDAPSFD